MAFLRSSEGLKERVSSLESGSMEREEEKGMRTHWSERSSGSESMRDKSCVSSSLSLSSLPLTVPVTIDISEADEDLLVVDPVLRVVGFGSSECECKNVLKEVVEVDDEDVLDLVGGRSARRKIMVVLSSSDSLKEEGPDDEGRKRRKGRAREVGDEEEDDKDRSESCSSSSVVASSSARCQYSWAST